MCKISKFNRKLYTWMWIRILIADPDLDPATSLNVDPRGSGSETLTTGRSGASRWWARVSQSLSASAYSRNSPSISRQVLGSISASSDTVESEGRQMKQCGIQYIEKKILFCSQCCGSALFSMRIRIQLFISMRIRIQGAKLMRIWWSDFKVTKSWIFTWKIYLK